MNENINYKNKLISRLESKQARIGVIGLGYVGLPLAILFAKSLGKRIGKAQGEASTKSGILIEYLTEIFKAAKIIKIYQKEERENINSRKVIDDVIQNRIHFDLTHAQQHKNLLNISVR